MFEFSRELKRILASDGPRDGLTGGDVSLLELLDMELLRKEARAADVAAGRVSAKDPSQRRLDAARVWRELARRTGDALALRNAAQAADKAAEGFKRDGRMRGWAAARCEQAEAALLGAELFGDDGLNAAAEVVLREVRQVGASTSSAAIAWGRLARLASREALASADYAGALNAAAQFDAPIIALEGHLRGRAVTKAVVAHLRCDRAELLMGCAARLKDCRLYEIAIAALDTLSDRLDPTYEPLAWSRVQELRGGARASMGEIGGGIEDIADGIELMVEAVDVGGPDHSPMDWARLQHALALALGSLGEASETDRAFEHALGAYDRALWATREQPHLALRAALSHNRAGCLARRAELAADIGMLDEAVEVMKGELSRLSPGKDPVGWAVAQVNLARLYEARAELPGHGGEERGAALMALTAALDVFGEFGLKSLSEQAARGLERLRYPKAS
jgi:tetratricopeptide (TPR) repeat protein